MQGVPTGFDKDIPRSHTLRPRRESDGDEGHELLICEGNWKGAEEDPALLPHLVDEELEAGYLEVIPDLETAFRRWGKERVAVGKVNIVEAPGRSPRLVVDNSICNTAIPITAAMSLSSSACPACRTFSPPCQFGKTTRRFRDSA